MNYDDFRQQHNFQSHNFISITPRRPAIAFRREKCVLAQRFSANIHTATTPQHTRSQRSTTRQDTSSPHTRGDTHANAQCNWIMDAPSDRVFVYGRHETIARIAPNVEFLYSSSNLHVKSTSPPIFRWPRRRHHRRRRKKSHARESLWDYSIKVSPLASDVRRMLSACSPRKIDVAIMRCTHAHTFLCKLTHNTHTSFKVYCGGGTQGPPK